MSNEILSLREMLEIACDGFLEFWDYWDVQPYEEAYGFDRFRDWYAAVRHRLHALLHHVAVEDYGAVRGDTCSLFDEECALKRLGGARTGLPLISGHLFIASELVYRIDCFLATVEHDRSATALGRSCRRDTTTLLVLADWCDDHGKPRSAQEARHLHAQVQAFIRDAGPSPFTPHLPWDRAAPEPDPVDPDVE
jgi:hypothetical protein